MLFHTKLVLPPDEHLPQLKRKRKLLFEDQDHPDCGDVHLPKRLLALQAKEEKKLKKDAIEAIKKQRAKALTKQIRAEFNVAEEDQFLFGAHITDQMRDKNRKKVPFCLQECVCSLKRVAGPSGPGATETPG